MDELEPSEYEKVATFAELKPDLATIKAQSWLNFYYDGDYFNPPPMVNIPFDKDGDIIPNNKTSDIQSYKLDAFPNPASN